MSNGYKELIKGNPGETEIRSFLETATRYL